jgi:hypothetical protein
MRAQEEGWGDGGWRGRGVHNLQDDGGRHVADYFLIVPHVLGQLVRGHAPPTAADPHAGVVPGAGNQRANEQCRSEFAKLIDRHAPVGMVLVSHGGVGDG